MAVRLRLRREGTKKKVHFRVVAADRRSPRDGRFIEIIGDYHPMQNPSVVDIDEERALHWLRNGATPSSQVENLLRITGIWEKFRPGDTARPEHPAEEATPSKKQQTKAAEEAPTDESAAEEEAEDSAEETPDAAADDTAAEEPEAAQDEPAAVTEDTEGEGDEDEPEAAAADESDDEPEAAAEEAADAGGDDEDTDEEDDK